MKPFIFTTLVIVFIFLNQGVQADDLSRKSDDTIAAGIVFKLHYIFAALGPWSNLDSDPGEIQLAFNTISKDLELFSHSKHGRNLKVEGEKLILFFLSVIDESKPIAPDADVVEIASSISDRMAAYAKLSNTPSWVYTPQLRKPEKAAAEK